MTREDPLKAYLAKLKAKGEIRKATKGIRQGEVVYNKDRTLAFTPVVVGGKWRLKVLKVEPNSPMSQWKTLRVLDSNLDLAFLGRKGAMVPRHKLEAVRARTKRLPRF